MKKFYYFSKSKLHFIEVENFYRKFVFIIFFFAILVAFFVLGSFMVFSDYINPDAEITHLKKKNVILKQKFENLLVDYKKLDQKLDNLSNQNHDLRLSANLESLEEYPNNYGTGGNSFEPFKIFDMSDTDNIINAVNSFTGKVVAKSQSEIASFNEIENALTNNEKFYSELPALKPAEGKLGDGFKNRFHPILKTWRMHNGTDIICDVGTKVYSPGAGVVSFVGWRNGLGLTVEIDHENNYKTIYGHLSKSLIQQGQKLKRCDLIALSGSSGLSTGPHLHYEVRTKDNDIPLNPQNFMYDDISVSDVAKKSKSH